MEEYFSNVLALSPSIDASELDMYAEQFEEIRDVIQNYSILQQQKNLPKPSSAGPSVDDIANNVVKKLSISSGSGCTNPPASATPRLKIPDMKPFDNTIRTYAAFKTKFRTHYEKHYGEHAVLVLKENLLVDYQKRQCMAATTVDEVFDLLDQSFGDAGKLTEIILQDLEALPKCRENSLDDLKFLRDKLNLARVDMKSVQMSKHIEQFQTVALIKRKLSNLLQRNWAENVAMKNIPTENRFTALIDFIDLEIRTLELIPTSSSGLGHMDNKPSSGAVRTVRAGIDTDSTPEQIVLCPIHGGVAPHFLYQCRRFKRMGPEERAQVIVEQAANLCRSCFKFRHASATCTVEIPPCSSLDGKCEKRHRSMMHDTCAILSKSDRAAHAYHSHYNFHPEPEKFCTEFSISPAQRVRAATSTNTNKTLNTLWDSGSNLTLILEPLCDKFRKLDEYPTKLTIDTVGNNPISQLAHRYVIPLLSNEDPNEVVA